MLHNEIALEWIEFQCAIIVSCLLISVHYTLRSCANSVLHLFDHTRGYCTCNFYHDSLKRALECIMQTKGGILQVCLIPYLCSQTIDTTLPPYSEESDVIIWRRNNRFALTKLYCHASIYCYYVLLCKGECVCITPHCVFNFYVGMYPFQDRILSNSCLHWRFCFNFDVTLHVDESSGRCCNPNRNWVLKWQFMFDWIPWILSYFAHWFTLCYT